MVVMDAFVAWHQALAFALLGQRRAELGEQDSVDLVALAAWFRDGRVAAVTERAAACRAAEQPWPYPLPDDLAPPRAQFAAALFELRRRLGLLGAPARPAPARRPGPGEERLRREVPPHHGSP